MERLIAETTFLVDLEREVTKGQTGPASSFLERHASTRLVITPVIAGELAAGVSLSQRETWRAFIGRFRVLDHDEDVSWCYGEAFRHLRDQGTLIGSNDLWIAAAARAHGVPVLTRNLSHYRRVPGIEVVGY